MTEAQRECPSCAMMVEAEAKECPVCGYEFPEPKPGFGPAAWLMAALLIVPVLWVLVRLLG